MTEAILLALWVGTTLFFICREIKQKSNRESHEWWLSDLRDCLHSIEGEFRWRCHEIAEVNQARRDYDTYKAQINELKKEYLNELYNKITERKGKYFVKTLPDYIVKGYEVNISKIADIYLDLGELYLRRRKLGE